jgi:chorismate mutase
MRFYALRGANSVASNDAVSIREATAELVQTLLERNSLQPSDLVSCLFTVTNDLDAEFPAAAAREIGLSGVPLLCAREIPVPDSMPHVVRVLVHYQLDGDHTPEHVYLGATKSLRPDLGSAQ